MIAGNDPESLDSLFKAEGGLFESQDDLDTPRKDSTILHNVVQNIKDIYHGITRRGSPKYSPIYRPDVREPHCWTKDLDPTVEVGEYAGFVPSIGVKIQSIDIDVDAELPEMLVKLVSFIRRHPNVGFKGGVARSTLKWMLGLREQSWMKSEIAGFNDIDLLVWPHETRYGETTEEVIAYFIDQSRCESPISIQPVDVEFMDNFHIYFTERDITQNQVLLWCLEDGSVKLIFTAIAEHDCKHGIIRVGALTNNELFQVPYVVDSAGHMQPCQKHMTRAISHYLKKRGVTYAISDEAWKHWRTVKLSVGNVYSLLNKQSSDGFLPAYEHLVSLGVIDRVPDPNQWWGEVLHEVNTCSARCGQRISSDEQTAKEVDAWKRGKKTRRMINVQAINIQSALDHGIVYDCEHRIDPAMLEIPDYLPQPPTDTTYEEFNLPDYSYSATVENREVAVDCSSATVLPTTSTNAHTTVKRAVELDMIPREFNYLTLWQTVCYSLKLLKPWQWKYTAIIVLNLVALVIRSAFVMAPENGIVKILGVFGSLIIHLLADVSMVTLMTTVTAGIRTKFVSNNLHRGAEVWSLRQRYPEYWSRFSGESGALETFASSTFPALVTNIVETVVLAISAVILLSISDSSSNSWGLFGQLGSYTLLLWLSVLALTPIIRGESRIVRQAMGGMYARAFAVMERIRTLQENNSVHGDVECFYEQYLQTTMKSRPLRLIKVFIPKFLSTISTITPYFVATRIAYLSESNYGMYSTMLVVFVYVKATNQAAVAWIQFCTLAGSLERFFVLFQPHRNCPEDQKAVEATQRIPARSKTGYVVLKVDNLHFNYPSNTKAEVLSIPGKHVFTSGLNFLPLPRGGGASTFGQLLCKHWDVVPGTIMINGLSIEKVDTTWMRNKVTVVDHDIVDDGNRFIDAVSFGLLDNGQLTYDKIWSMMDTANLTEVMHRMPQGMETIWWHTYMTKHERFVAMLVRACLRETDKLVYIEDPLRHCGSDEQRQSVARIISHLSIVCRKTVIVAMDDPARFSAYVAKSQ
eukprot:CFRG7150T1